METPDTGRLVSGRSSLKRNRQEDHTGTGRDFPQPNNRKSLPGTKNSKRGSKKKEEIFQITQNGEGLKPKSRNDRANKETNQQNKSRENQ
jgi:hypothetical protein